MTTPAEELRTAASKLRADAEAAHRAVGLALADWLDTEAASNAGDESHTDCIAASCTLLAALAVARAIGGQS